MDRPDGCDESQPAPLTHTHTPLLFFHFYHVKCQLLDNMSHLCVIWGPPGAHPAALDLPLSCKVIAGQHGTSAHTFPRVPNVLTEKILAVLASSPSPMNFALRLVRRSSSRRGGFTNTTYGMNSSEYTRFIFCRGGGGRRRKRRRRDSHRSEK